MAASLESTQRTWPDGDSPTAVSTGMCPDLIAENTNNYNYCNFTLMIRFDDLFPVKLLP